MIGAGKLDRMVQIQKLSGSQDSFGQIIKTWSIEATVPCWKKDLISTSSTEVEIADQEQTRTIAEFTIRYYPGLESGHRLYFENETYEIVRVAELGRRRYTKLIAYALSSNILD